MHDSDQCDEWSAAGTPFSLHLRHCAILDLKSGKAFKMDAFPVVASEANLSVLMFKKARLLQQTCHLSWPGLLPSNPRTSVVNTANPEGFGTPPSGRVGQKRGLKTCEQTIIRTLQDHGCRPQV